MKVGQEYKTITDSYSMKKGSGLNAKFTFTVDSTNVISESNENNNTLEKTVNIGAEPVLTIYEDNTYAKMITNRQYNKADANKDIYGVYWVTNKKANFNIVY